MPAFPTHGATNWDPQLQAYIDSVGGANGGWGRSNVIRDVMPATGSGNRITAITATASWEATAVQEASVWYFGGLYHMIYTGGTTLPRLGYASASSLLGPWTKNAGNPVIGNGAGGWAGNAYHSNVLLDGTTLYCYFSDQSTPTLLRVATASASAPTVWTMTGTTYSLQAGATQWGNTFVYKEAGGTYTMMFEQSSSTSSWQTGWSTLGSSPTGTQASVTWPIASLQPSAINVTGTASTGWLTKDSTGYIAYYHGGPTGSLPTQIYRATSTNGTTWVIDNNGVPILTREAPFDQDQVADPYLIQSSDGVWYLFYEGFDNTTLKSTIACVPMAPQLSLTDGATKRHVNLGERSTPSASPQKPKVTRLTVDKAVTTTASYTDVITSGYFVPTGSAVRVQVDARCSMSTSAQATWRIYTGSIINQIGSVAHTSGAQLSFAASTLLTGLVPGQAYQFAAAVQVSAGTWNCRNASFPNDEQMTLTVEDATA